MFGEGINLTWNGKEKFNTSFGAIITLVLIAILIAFTVLKAVDLFKRANPIVSRTSIIRPDNTEESLTYSPQDEGFDFSFGLKKQLDPRYGFFTVREVSRSISDGV